MARAGGGRSGGGSRSSGGGHRSSRSGGGHRVSRSSSSSSRARGGSFSGGSRGGFGGGPRGGGYRPPMGGHVYGRGTVPPPPPRGPRRYYRTVYTGGGYRRSGSFIGAIIYLVIIMMILSLIYWVVARRTAGVSMDFAGSGQASTIVREKLDSGNAYINDCIIDELDWFDNESKTETQLREFWEETGVQPYIILRDYDPSLTTDDAKEEWTMDYYDANFEREDIFLYVYFAEQDTENDVGYMTYAGGTQTTSVMDSEAVDIFWGYIDRYWYDDISTDDLFANAFNKTANSIMKVSTTSNDVMKWVVIVVGGIVVVAIINSIVKKNNQRKKEKAAEDQKILETPLEQIVDDELTKKYTE